MKILNSVSSLYAEMFPQAVHLQEEVNRIILSFINTSWYYFGRIKSAESFALKLETGRVENIREMEDLFACTIVVKDKSEISEAEKRIRAHFYVKKRRPREDSFTHKEPSSFEFDDLRLYVNIKPPEYLPPSSINDLVFEIQIKTFLEHAWSIATHDLIYKSDNISWSKERVAFQVRAMLELVEASINQVEALSQSPELGKNNQRTRTLNEIKKFLIETFTQESLPADLLRLSKNILNILELFELNVAELGVMLDSETALGHGIKTLDLSTYSIILQTIINQDPTRFNRAFKKGNKSRPKKFFIPREVDISKMEIEDDSKIVTF